MIKQYKNYLKLKKIFMNLSKILDKLTTAFTHLFILIGVLAVFSEIVDRVSTRKALKELGIGKTEKEDDVVKRIKF